MKKKFLSLMMAAAVVATTSVSAFAYDYSWSESAEQDADVTITGDVTSNSGETVPGTLSVSIPTTTTFTVSREGKVTAPAIKVQNTGTQSVDVYAYKFVDQTPNKGSEITVVGAQELKDASSPTTAMLSLRLSGSLGKAYLKSEATDSSDSSKNGVYTDVDCQTASTGSGVKLISVSGNNSESITLVGETKSGDSTAPNKAVQDNFVLTLKIKKAQKAQS